MRETTRRTRNTKNIVEHSFFCWASQLFIAVRVRSNACEKIKHFSSNKNKKENKFIKVNLLF